jgi:Mg-chelatase subunit ChlD
MAELTHITFVLDSSGSMSKIADDTKGGFNTFLADQREADGEATVSLYEFDTNVTTMYRAIPIAEASKLTDDTYTPGGQTALHDALATAIGETADHVETAPDRPDEVVVVTLTDGKENASETPADQVRETIETYREEHDWEFLFIGANQDAALTAEQMGMDADKSLSMSHTGEGTQAAYESTSERVREVRQSGSTAGYDEADRQRQRDADDT